MSLFFYGPAVAVFIVGIAMLSRLKKRLGVEAKELFPSFFGHLVGWGFIAVLVLVLCTILLTAATESPQGPLWLIFTPWVFAVGEVFGLVRWKSKYALT